MKYPFTLLAAFLVMHGLAFASQVPLFSGYQLCMQNYNPAYAGRGNSYEISLLHGHSYLGYSSNKTFRLYEANNNQPIDGPNGFIKAHFTNLNFLAPIRLNKNQRMGIGISYTDNHLNMYERSNHLALSLAYSHRVKKGWLALGVNIKRNTHNVSADRVSKFNPYVTILTKDIKSSRGNLDLGLMYSNDSNTFELGFSVNNLLKENYEVNNSNDDYRLSYHIAPQLLFHSGFQARISKILKSKNSVIMASNTQLKYTDYIARSLVYYKFFGLGAQYKHKNNSLGPALGFANKHLDVLYTYQITMGRFSSISSGFHELGLRLKI